MKRVVSHSSRGGDLGDLRPRGDISLPLSVSLARAQTRGVERIGYAVASIRPYGKDAVATAEASDVVPEIWSDITDCCAPVRRRCAGFQRRVECGSAVDGLSPDRVHQ